jgi:hypothetical protein
VRSLALEMPTVQGSTAKRFSGHPREGTSGYGGTRGLTAPVRRGFLAREGRPMRAAVFARVSTHDQQTLGSHGPAFTVSIMEFRDGKVIHETQYFADPFEAPDWRSQWVERIS